MMPIKIKIKTNISETSLFAADEMLKELMSLDIEEDTRLSDTLSLYNGPL
jgi:hypothetical protein